MTTTQQRAQRHDGRGSPRPQVVVGYDGSAGSVEALTWATVEASSRGADLTVLAAADLSAVASAGAPSLVDGVRAGQQHLAAEGVAWAVRVVEDLGGHRAATVRAQVTLTSPAQALVDASERADLVVVGNRGHGRIAGALLGSVAFSVTAAARCPVVVVRGDAQRRPGPAAPVVVGVDDSPGAGDALAHGADAAHRAGAPLVVLAAWSTPEVRAGGYAEPYGRELVAGARRTAAAVADLAADRARTAHPGLPVTTRVLEQRPAGALADASTDAGLVVVGARGRGGIASLLLGSVSHATVHAARCPVAVVRRPALTATAPPPPPEGDLRAV